MLLNDYVKSGYGRCVGLSKILGVAPTQVSLWCTGKRPVPVFRCIEIERVTEGAVTCEEMRPDIDWKVVRNKTKRK